MSINSSLVKNYENLLMFILIPTVAAATISIVGNSIFFNRDEELFGNVIDVQSTNRVFAQQIPTTPVLPANKITLELASAQFAPLTNSTFNQVKIIVRYKTNDASLFNTKINGIMRVSLLNGSIIKTSSFPNGFILNQNGTIQFATSFTDKTIQKVKADIVLTDLSRTNPLSNIVTVYVPYNISQIRSIK